MRAEGYTHDDERLIFPGGSPTRRGRIMRFGRTSG
jgi:hypothetical protein